MTVRVLFFSVLRDLTGREELVWDLPSEASVTDLLQDLFRQWPALLGWEESLLVAVDQTYVKRDQILHDRCEVAIMPPVQGG